MKKMDILYALLLFLTVPVLLISYLLFRAGILPVDLIPYIMFAAMGANITIWVGAYILKTRHNIEIFDHPDDSPKKNYPLQRVVVWLVIVGAISGYTGNYFGKEAGYDEGVSVKNSYIASVASENKEIGYDSGYNAGYNAGYADASGSTSTTSSSWSSSDTWSETVYVTDSGSKYHRWGCQYLWNSSNAISLDDAIARGYTACSKCW